MRFMLTTAALLGIASALVACGGTDTDAPVEAEIADEASAGASTAVAGTYTGTDAAGLAWTSTLKPDGTFEDSTGGTVTHTGTWTHDEARGTCFTVAGSPEQCFRIGTPAADGTVTVTDPQGRQMAMTRQAAGPL